MGQIGFFWTEHFGSEQDAYLVTACNDVLPPTSPSDVFSARMFYSFILSFFSLTLCCLPLVSPSILSGSSLPSRFHNRCHLLRQIINSGKFQSLFPRPFNLPPPFLSIPSISLLFTFFLTPIFQPSSPPRFFSTKQQFVSHLGKKKDTGWRSRKEKARAVLKIREMLPLL